MSNTPDIPQIDYAQALAIINDPDVTIQLLQRQAAEIQQHQNEPVSLTDLVREYLPAYVTYDADCAFCRLEGPHLRQQHTPAQHEHSIARAHETLTDLDDDLEEHDPWESV